MSTIKKQIFVRPVRPKEATQYWDWLVANRERSLFDPNAVSYPSTFSLCAFRQDGPVAYLPIQRAYMMESLAPRPSATDGEKAAALKELTQAAVTKAYEEGVREIYFIVSDQETADFAERNGFDEVPHKVYRMKLNDLEPKE